MRVTGATVAAIRRRAESAHGMAQAAYENEQLTRRRVELIERLATRSAGVLSLGFWGRLRWLLTGTVPTPPVAPEAPTPPLAEVPEVAEVDSHV